MLERVLSCGQEDQRSTILVILLGRTCDRTGPQAVGIQGFLLNRTQGQDFTDLTGFAEHVLAYNRR